MIYRRDERHHARLRSVMVSKEPESGTYTGYARPPVGPEQGLGTPTFRLTR